MTSLWVSEFGTIRRGNSNSLLDSGDIQLCGTDFESLLSLTEPISAEQTDQILTLYRREGVDFLKVRNFVGVLRTPSGLQIEVLPKVAKDQGGIEQVREQLVKMLMTLKDAPFRENQNASLHTHKMPLFELLIRYFLEEVLLVVKRGIARTYVSEQGNLRFIRGKLLVSRNIRENATNQARVYCEYDEFNMDRPVNRLITAALEVVSTCAADFGNIRLCRELLHSFAGVLPSKDLVGDFAKMKLDRSAQHYVKAMPLCELILKSMNPLTKQGQQNLFALMFPMERVFEGYVANRLRRQLANVSVVPQKAKWHLVDAVGNSQKRLFKLKPDLVIASDSVKLVADTKWKLLDSSDGGSSYGINQSDMYQLFAYGEKCMGESKKNEAVVLIYPKTESFSEPLPVFWFDEKKTKALYVLPFDLDTDELLGISDLIGPPRGIQPISVKT